MQRVKTIHCCFLSNIINLSLSKQVFTKKNLNTYINELFFNKIILKFFIVSSITTQLVPDWPNSVVVTSNLIYTLFALP